MESLEDLKRKTVRVDKDIAILNSELEKLTSKLKKEFNIDIRNVNINKYLAKVERDSEKITKKINRLYYKAEAALKGIKK